MTRAVVRGTRTWLPLLLVLGPGSFVLCIVALVAGVDARDAGCTARDTGCVTRANGSGSGNQRDVYLATYLLAVPVQIQRQQSKSNTAFGTKSLGPIGYVCGGLLGSHTHCYGFLARAVGPVASPASSLTAGPGSVTGGPFAAPTRKYSNLPIQGRPVYELGAGDWETSSVGCGTAWGGRLPCKENSSRVQIPDGPPIRGCSSVVEQGLDKAQVVGSNPSAPTIF